MHESWFVVNVSKIFAWDEAQRLYLLNSELKPRSLVNEQIQDGRLHESQGFQFDNSLISVQNIVSVWFFVCFSLHFEGE